jgi:hypothetical protein
MNVQGCFDLHLLLLLLVFFPCGDVELRMNLRVFIEKINIQFCVRANVSIGSAMGELGPNLVCPQWLKCDITFK